MKKKMLAVLLTAAMTLGLCAGCAGNSENTDNASSGVDENVESSGFKVGYNYFGTGGYSLAALTNQTQIVLDACGNESVSADDQFSVETLIKDVENMISSGCDGVVVWLPAEALYPQIVKMCEDAGVYFVLNDKVPTDPTIREQVVSSEYFAGACAPENAVYGEILAEYALSQGWETCITTSSAEGDASDQPRLDAFKEKFESEGGVILAELHSDTTADSLPAVQDALIANEEPDFIYGVGSDYAINACTALNDYPDYETKVITSGLDKDALELLMDENSPMVMINGDYWISGLFSAVMLQNALEGNVLKDADGNVIYVENIQPFEVSTQTYDLYEKYFMNEPVYSAEEIQAMVGITYDEMMEIINNYSLENRLMEKYEAGVISAEEMEAAGFTVE